MKVHPAIVAAFVCAFVGLFTVPMIVGQPSPHLTTYRAVLDQYDWKVAEAILAVEVERQSVDVLNGLGYADENLWTEADRDAARGRLSMAEFRLEAARASREWWVKNGLRRLEEGPQFEGDREGEEVGP